MLLNYCYKERPIIPFEAIEYLANEKMISLRSVCFCNPGIDEINNSITHEEMVSYFSSHNNGDYHDMVKYLGKMIGAIRVSVGLATNYADLEKFIALSKMVANK